MTYPLRYQGRLIPEMADHFRALQLLPHLQARGLILNLDHRALVELGRALREADQDLDLDQYLAEVRMGQDQGMDQIGGPALLAPEHPDPRSRPIISAGQVPGPGNGDGRSPDPGQPPCPTDPDRSGDAAMGLGGTDPASGAGTEDHVPFDPIKHYLETVRDEDEPWPT